MPPKKATPADAAAAAAAAAAPEAREGRSRTQADADLEAAQAETAAVEQKLAELNRRYEENTMRLTTVRRLEDQLIPLEDQRKRISARFKKALLPDGGATSSTAAAAAAAAASQATSAPADGCATATAQKALKELVAASAETVLRILGETFRAPAPAQPKKDEAAAAAAAAGGGAPADEESAAEEFVCPVGVSAEAFNRVVELRQGRLTNDEELESVRRQLHTLRDEAARERAEGIGKPLIRRTEKVLGARREEEKAAAHRVQQEEDEWNRAKEEEEWKRQLRAQVEGDASAAAGGGAPKGKK